MNRVGIFPDIDGRVGCHAEARLSAVAAPALDLAIHLGLQLLQLIPDRAERLPAREQHEQSSFEMRSAPGAPRTFVARVANRLASPGSVSTLVVMSAIRCGVTHIGRRFAKVQGACRTPSEQRGDALAFFN